MRLKQVNEGVWRVVSGTTLLALCRSTGTDELFIAAPSSIPLGSDCDFQKITSSPPGYSGTWPMSESDFVKWACTKFTSRCGWRYTCAGPYEVDCSTGSVGTTACTAT